MEIIIRFLETFQNFIWGPPTLILLMGTGVYFTWELQGIQFFKFPRALRSIFEKEEGAGEVSAFLGMTTKYAEALLAVKFRVKDENGQTAGGPMYYIQNGMGERYKWLAKLFTFFGVVTALLGCGTFPQVNAITESVSDTFQIPVIVIGAIVTILTAVVTLGGIQSISKVAEAAKTNSCVKQGLISITSVFFTTLVTCTMTGLVIISSGLLGSTDLSGGVLVTKAYNMDFPFNMGMYLVAIGIIFFSFTTILGWNYYGERCIVYLTGSTKSIKIFKVIYIAAIAVAPFLTLEPIWLLADITNALMIIPNLIALLALRKVVINETKKFFDREERTKVNVTRIVGV